MQNPRNKGKIPTSTMAVKMPKMSIPHNVDVIDPKILLSFKESFSPVFNLPVSTSILSKNVPIIGVIFNINKKTCMFIVLMLFSPLSFVVPVLDQK